MSFARGRRTRARLLTLAVAERILLSMKIVAVIEEFQEEWIRRERASNPR
jgi:hypothetical protein